MRKRLIYFFICGFLAGCAQLAMPTGGDKDVRPPEALAEGSTPKNGSVNFSSQRIYIEFDEYIKLQPGKQPIVSPPVNPAPVLSVKGKRLMVDLPEKLQPNTTYSIHFPGVIADITENNLVENFSYVFSTGNFIDTGMVTGNVLNALTHMPQAKVWVLLFADTVTTPLTRALPSGIAKTNSTGIYRIENVKKGRYFLAALTDINNNLKFDLPGEGIAFSDMLITVDTIFTAHELLLFKPREKQFKRVSDISLSATTHKISFNTPVANMRITAVKNTTNFNAFFNEKGDSTAFVSFTSPLLDTAWLQISSGEQRLDTIYLLPEKNKKFVFSASAPTVTGLLPNQEVEFQANDWCRWDSSLVTVFDTVTKKIISPVVFSNGIRPTLRFAHRTESVYKITLQKGALYNAEKKSSDSLGFFCRWLEPEKYGTLQLTYDVTAFNTANAPVIFDLFRTSPLYSDTIRTQSSSGKITFTSIRPGNYSLRVFIDRDNNGRWTPGDFEVRQQPEFSFLYPQSIQIRANWDMELNWKPE